MIEALFNQTNYLAAKQMLQGTVNEREAIAINLANVETPNYHRLQVSPSFKEQLQEAVRTQDSNQVASLSPSVEEDPNAIASRMDGNNVVMEKEMLNLMHNSVDHAFETQLITGNLLRMRLAITGHS